MDKAQARFILQSFRPDGADVDDHDFAEALALAVEDRELGEWLAHQRAFDAAFANALASIKLPESLRRNILGCLAAERGDFPQVEDERDAAMVGALASIQVPQALRNRILTAMDRSVAGPQPAKIRPLWPKLAVPLAAAAGVTLAFLVTSNAGKPAITKSQRVHVDLVQAGFIRTFESPLFSLDETWEDPNELADYLKSRKLPCPGCLPPGLVGVQSIGCRELVVDGKKGSMICFDEQEVGSVHLIIFRREDVSGSLPQREHPSFAQEGNWASARWEDDRHVFLLVGATEVRKLAGLF
jgi:hypothetical protein